MLEWNEFNSPCHPNPPIKFGLNPTYSLGADSHGLKIFKMATMVAILDIGTEQF